MAKEIYILFDCNEWKEYSSMRVHLVTTDVNRLHQVIRGRIAKGDYPVDGMEEIDEALARWDDIVARGTTPSDLQDHLTYAATMVYNDGEPV